MNPPSTTPPHRPPPDRNWRFIVLTLFAVGVVGFTAAAQFKREPKGAVARSYGAYHEAAGTSERALFVIDGTGTIRWSYKSPMGVNPGADGILEALDALSGVKA